MFCVGLFFHFKHPYFNPNTYENDIILLKLKQNVNTSDPYTKIACLPERVSSLYPGFGIQSFISGWVILNL